jgi:hypothetical protein
MAATDPEHDYNVFRDHEITARRSLAIPLTDLDRTLARDWANIRFANCGRQERRLCIPMVAIILR